MSKGMELPINMIVVVLIAVLVLTTVGIFLTRQLGGGASNIDYQQLWGQACTKLRFQNNCVASNFDITDNNGNPTTFSVVCQKAVGLTEVTPCARQCGCS
ncbi:MAG TPA: hypothetical protein VJI12_01825 [archaeon]|nr:hypothetical protein [archaeon]